MGVFKKNNELTPHPFIFTDVEDDKIALDGNGRLQDNVYDNPTQISPFGVPSDYFDDNEIVFGNKRILKIRNNIEESFQNSNGDNVGRTEADTRNPLIKNRSICYSISFYIPSRIVDSEEQNIVKGIQTQWHGGTTNPFCNFSFMHERIALRTRWESGGFSTGYMYYDLGPLSRDTWYHFIIFQYLDYNINLGRRTVWQKTGSDPWGLARLHSPGNPETGTGLPWIVPTEQNGLTSFSNSDLWIAYPAKGTMPMNDGTATLLDWHGKTWYDLPISSIYHKWGKYDSEVDDFYNADGTPKNTTDPLAPYYIEPGSYDESWFTNVNFGLLDVGETEGDLFQDFAHDGGQPIDYPADMDFTLTNAPTTYALTLAVDPAGFGTVDQTPAGPHEAGATVALSATPGAGNQFDGWYDGATLLSTANPYNYTTLAEAKTITGQFSQIPAALVGHWKMEEGSGSTLIDDSDFENNATIQNTSGVTWVDGMVGLALRLNGSLNRFATVPHNASLDINDEITIAAWIRPDGIARKQVLSKGNDYELSIFENGKVEFRINRSTDAADYMIQSVTDYPTDGVTWMYVAATFDGTTSKIYINGVEDNSATYPALTINSNISELQVGAQGGNNRWEGDLDEVRLYNYALNGAEISTIYNEEYTAPATTYALTLAVDPAGFGTVDQTPAGPHEAGATVALSATPGAGNQFDGWYDGDTLLSTANPYNYTTLAEAKTITGQFSAIPATTYALSVVKTPDEGGTVAVISGSTLEAGAPAEVLATAAAGYAFQYWQDGAGVQVSTAANYLFAMPAADLQLTAVFFPTYTVEVTVSPAGFGTAEVSPPTPQIAWEQTTITATPATGKQFVRWSIGGSTFSEANPHTFSNPGFNYEILAEFEDVPPPPSFALTLAKNITAGGTVTEVSSGPYQEGDPVDVLAAPATGYEFLRWEIGGMQVSTAASYQFTMPADDTTITAIFLLITHPLTLAAMPEGSGTLIGAGSYAPGTVVQLGAQAASGWAFSYWMAADQVLSTNATFNYTMPTAAVTVTAFFESTGTASLPGEFSLSLSTAGTAGVAEGGGIFTEGSAVTVTATPLNTNLGGRFLYWKNGDQIVSYQPQYTFAMPSENTFLTAHFELSEMNTAQDLVMVRDYVKVSVMPTIPDEGIIEMECTLRFEQEYLSGETEDIAYYVNPYLYDLSRVDFHLDRALLGRMRFHRPDLSISLDPVPCTGIVHRYGFTYRLMVDGEPTGSETVESGLHAWLAGKPYAFPDVNPWEGKAYLWLTTRPMVRLVHPMERNIFYILPLETGEHTLETVIHYKNTIKETTTRSLGSQDRYRPFFFRYFLPDDWEDILQIELAIRGRILTEEVLTLRPQADPQFASQVFFGNSLGGFDSFCFAGKQENFSETTGELFETALQPDHDRQEGTLSAYNRGSHDSLILRTGYVSLAEKNALKDMSLRNHIYLVDGTELRKILLENTESFDSKDGTYIHSAEYRARLAFDNNSYYGRDPRQ